MTSCFHVRGIPPKYYRYIKGRGKKHWCGEFGGIFGFLEGLGGPFECHPTAGPLVVVSGSSFPLDVLLAVHCPMTQLFVRAQKGNLEARSRVRACMRVFECHLRVIMSPIVSVLSLNSMLSTLMLPRSGKRAAASAPFSRSHAGGGAATIHPSIHPCHFFLHSAGQPSAAAPQEVCRGGQRRHSAAQLLREGHRPGRLHHAVRREIACARPGAGRDRSLVLIARR